MNILTQYEKKIISDKEFPVQIFVNREEPGRYFSAHWHEHIEMHYIVKGKVRIQCSQKQMYAEAGHLIICNGNELHEGFCEESPMEAIVIIFELDALSKELANQNVVFHHHIANDATIQQLVPGIYKECEERQEGYKLAAKGMIYQLLAYLIRTYSAESLTDSEWQKRDKMLKRLNTVLAYMEKNYTKSVTNRELADLVHLSEGRFNHIFKESIGSSPLNYLNEVRLKKAWNLLKQKELSVSEVAAIVGFQDLNNFSRQFKRSYGYPPSRVGEAEETTGKE
ncbi:MAG: helix-turn-helix domain-containing protein [Lachnospiraceae bacterium]|nr:helix-turn-helix transcriptional regulator [Candidatus Fimimorpha excrementavium]